MLTHWIIVQGFDVALVQFIGNNWLTLGVLFSIAAVLAKLTKSTVDDDIVAALSEAAKKIRKVK
jgi:hypothetical protein